MLQNLSSFLYRLCCLLLITTANVPNATAQQVKHLVIGVEDIAYYPYFDYTRNEASLSKAILDKFAADQGYTISYVALPIKQFSKWLYENDIDFKYPDNKRWHPANKDHNAEYFSDDIFYLRAGTVVLLQDQDRPKAFFKSLGMISGFDPTLWKAEIASGKVNILDDSSTKVLIKHLVSGLVDGVDIDIAVAEYYLASLGIEQQLTYSSALPQDVFSHQLSTIKYPEIIQQFNQWLAHNGDFLEASLHKFHVPIEQPTLQKDQ